MCRRKSIGPRNPFFQSRCAAVIASLRLRPGGFGGHRIRRNVETTLSRSRRARPIPNSLVILSPASLAMAQAHSIWFAAIEADVPKSLVIDVRSDMGSDAGTH